MLTYKKLLHYHILSKDDWNIGEGNWLLMPLESCSKHGWEKV